MRAPISLNLNIIPRASFAAQGMALTAILALLATGCEEADVMRDCAYDKYFAEAISTDADTLYSHCYQNMVMCSNSSSDEVYKSNIRGTDDRSSDFVRGLVSTQELPADLVLCSWHDKDVVSFVTPAPHKMSSSTSGFFLRCLLGVRLCDKYLSTHKGIDKTRDAEVRLLRAIYHLYLLDTYGNAAQSLCPEGVTPFAFIEQEVKLAMPDLPRASMSKAGDASYGKMNRGVALMTLARLYLNAESYGEPARWTDALAMSSDVINCGAYALSTNGSTMFAGTDTAYVWSGYQKLFMGDNGSNGAEIEAIMPLAYGVDGRGTYGGTTFLSASCFDGDLYVALPSMGNGMPLHWMGNRARPELVRLFVSDSVPNADTRAMTLAAGDDRALLDSKGRKLECTAIDKFADGYAITKYHSLRCDGRGDEQNSTSTSHFFLMRLAEAYLTAAEASWRLGKTEDALGYINVLRHRAHAAEITRLSHSGAELLDEWGREFYFEGRRRTDLRRFGEYCSNSAHTWSWKGGSRDGNQLPASCAIYEEPELWFVDSQIKSRRVLSDDVQPSDLYFITGEGGLVQNPWEIEAKDVGIGSLPFSQTDSAVLLVEYLRTGMTFKMFGELGCWDDQYGMGKGGEIKHNDGASGNIGIESDGIWAISINKSTGTATVQPWQSKVENAKTVLAELPNRMKVKFTKCSPANVNSHMWMCDIATGDYGFTRVKLIVNGNEVSKSARRYGVTSSVDRDNFLMLRTGKENKTVRLIYNDILNSVYVQPMTE